MDCAAYAGFCIDEDDLIERGFFSLLEYATMVGHLRLVDAEALHEYTQWTRNRGNKSTLMEMIKRGM